MNALVETAALRHVDAAHFPATSLHGDARALRRILACIDRSVFSEACLRHAVAIAKTLGGTITLLHVMEPLHARAGLHATDVLDWEIARQEAKTYLEGLEHEGTRAAGRPVEIRIEEGHPAERISAVARELDVDLTILGNQGEHPASAWNLGSTVQQVLAVARGSVLIARSTSTAAPIAPTRILVPLDGSLRAESVLPTAVRISSAGKGELLLAFVVCEPIPTAVLRAPEDIEVARDLATRLEASGKVYLEGLRDQLLRDGAHARTVVLRSTDEKQSILELSKRERSDLIVLSAHGTTCNPELTYGSMTAHLLHNSDVPLLVLQDLRDAELRVRASERSAPPLRASYAEGL